MSAPSPAGDGEEAATEAIQEDVDEGVQLEDVLEDDAHAPVVPGQEEMDQGKGVTRTPVTGQNENWIHSESGVASDELTTAT